VAFLADDSLTAPSNVSTGGPPALFHKNVDRTEFLDNSSHQFLDLFLLCFTSVETGNTSPFVFAESSFAVAASIFFIARADNNSGPLF